MGKGRVPGLEKVIEHNFTNPHPINSIGLSTWRGITAEWFIGESYLPPPNPGTGETDR